MIHICKTQAELDAAEITSLRSINADLYAALAKLTALIDEIDHTAIGEETDRVFASYEFDDARAALKKARGEK